MRGQAIVELALAMPVMLLIGLGFLEAGILVTTKAAQDRDTAVVAEFAATRPSEDWHAVLATLGLNGCAVSVTRAPALVTATSTCAYKGKVTSGVLDVDISSEESAVPITASPQ